MPARFVRHLSARFGVATLCVFAATAAAAESDASHAGDARAPAFCAEGRVLASGPPDPQLFSRAASRGVVAEWCEAYDEFGHVRRSGPYRERYRSGRSRLEARYVNGRLEGPILAFDEDGFLFVRGELRNGRWIGTLSLLLPNGTAWFDANYVDGRLHGVVAIRHPDGALAAETRFTAGREQGLARSFYPTALGGGLLSEIRIEADAPAGPHRLFDDEGTILAPLDPDHPLFATVLPLPTRPAAQVPRKDARVDALTPVASIGQR